MIRCKRAVTNIVVFIYITILVATNVFATSPVNEKLRSQTIPVGKVEKNTEGLMVRDIEVPTYKVMGISYVLVSDLRKVGASLVWDAQTGRTIIYDLNQPINEEPIFESLNKNVIGYLGRDKVYINYQEVPAIFAEGRALIPAKWLPVLLEETPNPFQVLRNAPKLDNEGRIEQRTIHGINIWFNGKDYVEEPYDFSNLKFDEFAYYQDTRYAKEPDYVYVGFIITEIDGIVNHSTELYKAWLKNPTYYTIPAETPKEVINELFPDTRVKGIMKYATGGFAKGETVSVLMASSGRAYYLQDGNGKRVEVPWNSVSIQKSPVTKEAATKEQIEQYINSKDFSSKTNYFVWTDIYRQRTYVFKGKKNNWTLIKTMLSSTGKDTHLTPVGRYTLNVRVPYFGVDKGYRAKNAYAFIGTTYLYHSVLYDSTGTYLLNGKGGLGNKASAGCIRLSPEDSVWFYKNMPIGTGIFIN